MPKKDQLKLKLKVKSIAQNTQKTRGKVKFNFVYKLSVQFIYY